MTWPPAVGEPLPRAQDAYGVDEKLRAYSLNPSHDVGSHKARVFRSVLGITLDDVDNLTEQLLVGVLTAPVIAVRDNAPHGFLCEVSDLGSRRQPSCGKRRVHNFGVGVPLA